MQPQRLEMRIVAGKYKRRKILAPKSEKVRPTKDRIREAIFSALGNISGLSFLDLYAGSGAFGIEALSRDASNVVFVDNFKESIACVKDNLKSLSITTDYEVLFMNDTDALNKIKEEDKSFEIIFMDPPYLEGKYCELIDFILENNILNNNGIIITESNVELNIDTTKFKKIKNYSYGGIFVNIYWR